VTHRWTVIGIASGALVLALAGAACKAGPTGRPVRTGPVNTGPGSLEATRRTLEGTWTLASLEAVGAGGARRPVKATGTLTYDAFGNMLIRGVIDDAALKGSLALDYDGRILIDPAKKEFYAENLKSDQPVDPKQIAPIAPDKIRRYELSPDSFVVTYVDAAGNPTAVARWRR